MKTSKLLFLMSTLLSVSAYAGTVAEATNVKSISSSVSLSLTQNGNAVIGYLILSDGISMQVFGSVSGNSVTIQAVDTERNESTGDCVAGAEPLVGTLTVSDDGKSIKGTLKAPMLGHFEETCSLDISAAVAN